jgi:hypothetical protein
MLKIAIVIFIKQIAGIMIYVNLISFINDLEQTGEKLESKLSNHQKILELRLCIQEQYGESAAIILIDTKFMEIIFSLFLEDIKKQLLN